jgi:hypothetical protein
MGSKKTTPVQEVTGLIETGKILMKALRAYMDQIGEVENEQPDGSGNALRLLSVRAEALFAYEHTEKAVELMRKLEPEEITDTHVEKEHVGSGHH